MSAAFYYIRRGEKSSGPYLINLIREKVKSGSILLSDFAWSEGMESWVELSKLPDLQTGSVPVPPNSERPVARVVKRETGQFVYISFDESSGPTVTVNTVPEARIAIKELRVLKKMLSLKKREVTARQRTIRAEYTDRVRKDGPKFPGGGGIGRFIRVLQTADRSSRRSELASRLAPLESKRCGIEAQIQSVDILITQLEANLLYS